MKKTFSYFLALCLAVMFAGFTAAAEEPSAVIITPERNITLPAGYDAIVEVEAASADYVDILDGGQNIGRAEKQESGIFRLEFQLYTVGYHTITAEAHTGGSSEQSAPVIIRIKSYEKISIVDESFDSCDYFISNSEEDESFGGSKHRTAGIADVNRWECEESSLSDAPKDGDPSAADEERGKAVRIYQSDLGAFAKRRARISYNGLAIDTEDTSVVARINSRISVQADFYMKDTAYADKNGNPLRHDVYPVVIAYSDSGGAITNFIKFAANGHIQYINTGTSEDLGTYDTDRWYNVRVDIDMEQGLVDCYIDNVRVVAQRSFVVADGFIQSGFNRLYTEANAFTNREMELYEDNLKVDFYRTDIDPRYVYVNTDGSEDYSTIQDAFNGARAGDVIVLRDGEYGTKGDIQTITVKKANCGIERAPITLTAESENHVIYDRFVINAPYITIDGINMDGDTYRPEGDLEIGDPRGNLPTVRPMEVKNHHFRLVNSTIQNYPGVGVALNDYGYVGYNHFNNVSAGVSIANNCVVEYNDIENLNTFWRNVLTTDCFHIFGTNIVIRGNYLHGTAQSNAMVVSDTDKWETHSDFIQSYDSKKIEVSNVLVEDNIAFGHYRQGLMLENSVYGPSGIYYIHDITVRNNVFAGFNAWGICAGKTNDGIPNMYVENNTFVGDFHNSQVNAGDCAWYGVGLIGNAGSGTIKNNLIVNCKYPLVARSYGENGERLDNPDVEVSGNVSLLMHGAETDPAIFVDVDFDRGLAELDYNDYHLVPEAAAIDAGVDSVLIRDMDGNLRKTGAAVDAGAYEFTPVKDAQITSDGSGTSAAVTFWDMSNSRWNNGSPGSFTAVLAGFGNGRLQYAETEAVSGGAEAELRLEKPGGTAEGPKLIVIDENMTPVILPKTLR